MSPRADLALQIPDTTLVREFDGESVLLNLKNESYFGLDTTGTFIWQRIAEGRTLKEIEHALTERFDVDLETAAQDLHAFVQDLLESQLVESPDASNPPA